MKQLEQAFEKQYVPIEPGWNIKKEKVMQDLQVPERSYLPIEPEGFLASLKKLNPYRGSLRFFLENFEEKPRRTTLELMALLLIPGGELYTLKELNNIKREICSKKGEKFEKIKFDKGIKNIFYATELIKPVVAGLIYLIYNF
jgi:hypothetical protein